MSVTSDIGPVVSEVLLVSMGFISMRGAVRIWREKPRADQSHDERDPRPLWLIAGALPTGLCILSLAFAFPLSYGVDSKDGPIANTCFVAGGLFFIVAAVCAVVLVYEVMLMIVERPLPRLLLPPSRRGL
ncbi:MAG: hypothetical protein WA786_11320 [Acidimicrobiales bacterium]